MMNDTQWPRFQVFLQEKIGTPHQDVGSVHAPDVEMALMNARDVFVRRPDCVSLWVVPAEAIFSKTAQELAAGGWHAEVQENQKESYLVFNKARPAGTQTFVGEVTASNPQEVLEIALERYSSAKPPFAWWVFSARLVLESKPEDVGSMFAPARDKHFRMPQDFHTLTAMREITAATDKNPSPRSTHRPRRTPSQSE